MGLLGKALQHDLGLIKPDGPLAFLQKKAFPVYIVHQVVLLLIAEYCVFHIGTSIAFQLGLLIILGFVVSLGLVIVIEQLPLIPQLVLGKLS